MSDADVRQYGTIVVCGGGCYGGYYVRQLARARAAGAMRFERILVVDSDPSCPVAQLASAIQRGDMDAIEQHGWRLRRADADGGSAPSLEPRTIDAYLALPITLVSETWDHFFDRWFAAAIAAPHGAASDAVVPSPLMPNLLANWVASRIARHRPASPVSRIPMPVAPVTPWSRAGGDGSHYASFATWMCPINCVEPPRCPETRGHRDWTMPAAVKEAADAARLLGTPYDVVALFTTTHRAFGVGMFDVSRALDAERAIEASSRLPLLRTLVASVSHCHGALAALESKGALEN